MSKVNFDDYAEHYNKVLEKDLEFYGEKNSYFAEYKIKIIKDLLTNDPTTVLDYGCGIGRNIKYFSQYFPQAKIYGCDISEKSLEIASKLNPKAELFQLNDDELEKHKDNFDMIFVSCVFHHIHPTDRNNSIKIINSLLKNMGSLFIFEHNPFNPLTRHVVNNCAFDADAILLKPKESVELVKNAGLDVQKKNYTLFLPAILKGLRFLEKYVGFIPIGGQYYIFAIK